ncbi:MAG: hypothetical protein V4773_12790, partial [Verrucomicrobiota bacterium]
MTRHTRAALTFLVAFVLTLTATSHAVENTWDYSVQVSSSLQTSPAKITLTWPQDTNGVPSGYIVSRRTPGSANWGEGKTLPGSATTFVDNDVVAGTPYEYRIVKNSGSYTGYGYIQTAIAAPLVDSRGKVILVVDNTVSAPLASELSRLERDLAGDGWQVLRREVGRSDSVTSVKAVIKAAYDSDSANVKSVFLFGHIPVPYSGNFNPDGHPDHVGAWPADAFYGDMDGSWTDNSVNYAQTLNTDAADAARMTNKPGDGKFDQTTLPSPVELQVGRVDLSNLPGRTTWGGPATFASEIELLRKYLNKDHDFRNRKTNPARRALLGDYFGQRGGEAFAASGFRSFAPLVGAENIRNLNKEFNDQKGLWIKEAAAQDYLLAYACGAGSYATIAGLGNTGIYNDGAATEMVQNDVRGVFNLLFGSWLGDWDHEDNILRAPLATSHGLVSVWSGRPHWFIHPMGLGETIGYTARLAMNNAGDYQTQINSAQNRVHIALMGDPTLRLHPVVPVANLNGTVNSNTVALTWSASSDSAIVGYHVYRADSLSGTFARLTALPVTALSYSDANGSATATYMVRAIKLESTTSGSYYNAAQGVFWSSATGSTGGSEGIVATTPPASDTASNTTPVVPPADTTTPPASTPPATSPAVIPTDDVVWFDDALPIGAGGGATGGDAWSWIASNPAPVSGTVAHQSNVSSGHHEHFFNWAGETLAVAAGDKLFVYVYIDPANVPSELMVSWCSNSWEHRAYWGADQINSGVKGTASRHYAGALPAAGEWVRLEVPASAVAVEGAA